MIIAIDGPAGSGKSTTARALASRLGFVYLDTGAMYRTVALRFLRANSQPTDENARALIADAEWAIEPTTEGMRISLDGEDVTDLIRSPDVTSQSSIVSALPYVRLKLVEEQRRMARRAIDAGMGVIVEGRDIGTVVFPDADVKIFLSADQGVRARRRGRDRGAGDTDTDWSAIEEEIRERDERDQNRAISPLRKPDDAIEIDTSNLSFDEQVARIVDLAREQSV